MIYKYSLSKMFMGSITVKIKIMPLSPQTELELIKEKAKNIIEEEDGKNCVFEEEPIAFGLKAINIFFIYPENQELDDLEKRLEKMENVSSIQVIDIRRAIR